VPSACALPSSMMIEALPFACAIARLHSASAGAAFMTQLKQTSGVDLAGAINGLNGTKSQAQSMSALVENLDGDN
ncbi:MAG: hypothetical protein AAGM45_18530, partial [Cyanobacteria bacterium J06588_5]